MTIQKIQLGKIGEGAAAAFLKQHGYVIIERNFSNYLGEIDIIAYDGDVLCFVEVKTRNSDRLGSPFEAVPPVKQRKIGRVALSYLQYKGLSDTKARFDVIAVIVNEECAPSVEIIKNAFEYI